MKTGLKILLWSLVGAGIGFFGGYQVGMNGRKRLEKIAYDQGVSDGYFEANKAEYETTENRVKAEKAIDDYRGNPEEEEEAEMPEDIPEIGDENDVEVDSYIPELHPEHMTKELISEDEYYDNPYGDVRERLLYYEEDGVLYNSQTKECLHENDPEEKERIDEIIGIGMLTNFYRKDGEILDAIFVRDPNGGAVYRIDRIDAKSTDEISGMDAPEYEEEED